MEYYLGICCFVFGLVIGSFLNVIIYRIPKKLSIIHPGSSCPLCGRPIRAWENIPLISYFFILKGRCAGCGKRISIQYPGVELFTALVFSAVAVRYGFSFEMFVYLAFSAVLIALSVIDLQTQLLPNTMVLPGLLIACLLALGTLYPGFQNYWRITPVDAFYGMVTGGLPLFLIAWIYLRCTGREGMGGGDIKLMLFVGALLGPGDAFLTLFLGSLTGSLIGIVYLRLSSARRYTRIPFGPFLSLGAWVAMMWGEQMFQLYLSVMGLSQ
jgi:leader peptidase (prepilin peptidase) / N-methyltransferase